MPRSDDKTKKLTREVEELRARLEEAEATLQAIRNGEVDALVVSGPQGDRLYTLQGADEPYRILIEQMQEGAVTLAPDGTIHYCNRRFGEMLRLHLERVIGRPFAPFVAPADRRALATLLRERVGKMEGALLATDGTYVPVQLTANALRGDEARRTCLVVTDLTEHERNEEMVTAERLAQSILENATEAIVLCDPRGRVLRVNDAARRLCDGDPVGEVFASSFPIQGCSGACGRQSREGWSATKGVPPCIEDALKGQTVQSCEVTLPHPVHAPPTLIFTAGPLFGDDQQIVGIVVTLTDITVRKRTEVQIGRLNRLKVELFAGGSLSENLKRITDGVVDVFGADFARIWVLRKGDLCGEGCRYAAVTEGPDACRDRTRCLHLVASSGRYDRVDGSHRRVPVGAHKIGRVASGDEPAFLTNDAIHDPRIHDREWAASIGLVALAGYRLLSAEGRSIGVMALFSRRIVAPEEDALLQDLSHTVSQVVLSGAAEEALRESEQRLHRILLSSPIPTFVIDKDHRVVVWNKAIEELCGIKFEAVAGTTNQWRAFYSEPRPCMADLLVDGREGDVASWYPGRYSKSSLIPEAYEATGFFPGLGERGRWIRFTAATIRDSSGGMVGAIETLEDISARKEAIEALRESEARYRGLFDGAPVGIFQTMPSGQILDANAAMLQMLGYPDLENLRTVRAVDLWVDDETRKRWQELMEHEGVARGIESRLRRRDGQIVEVRLNTRVVRSCEGHVLWYEGSVEDFTTHKRAAEALEWESEVNAAQAKLARSLIAASAPLEDIARIVLNCAMPLTKSQHGFVSVVDPATGDNVAYALTRMIESHDAADSDNRIVFPKGRDGRYPKLWGHALNIRAGFFTNSPATSMASGGVPSGHVALQNFLSVPAVIHDHLLGQIALANAPAGYSDKDLQGVEPLAHLYALAIQRNRAEEELRKTNVELERKNQEVEQLLYTVSHDLKSPLVTIQGFVSHLSRDATSGRSDRLIDHSKRIQAASGRMAKLIDDLLEFSRIGRLVSTPSKFELTELVREVIGGHGAELANARISVEIQEDMPTMTADRDRIFQVIDNLVVNAMKYGSGASEPRIEIGGRRQKNETRIFVRDNGKGIPAQFHAKIFGLFQRLESDKDGVGVGLAVVKRIVEMHGGRVWVESRPGEGAALWLAFPAREKLHTREVGGPEAGR
jgi:PAS domain S-box-containing protein